MHWVLFFVFVSFFVFATPTFILKIRYCVAVNI